MTAHHFSTATRLIGATAAALTVLTLAVAGCTTHDDRPDDTPLPTVAVDATEAMCGLHPASIATATGLIVTTVKENFTGTGADLRGTCDISTDNGDRSAVWLTVRDTDSETCVAARDIIDGRSDWPETVGFTRLDGGAWARVRASDPGTEKGTSSAAFVGDACINITLTYVAEGRAPVPDIEALTQQAIATLGLDPSSA